MTRLRKSVFYLISIALFYVLAEGVAFVGYSIAQGEFFSLAELTELREEIIDDREKQTRLPDTSEAGRDNRHRQEILHPYMGYVIDYHDTRCSGHGFCDDMMRSYENAPVTPKSEDDYMVGVFGGSFAAQTTILSSEGFLAERLRTLPGLADKRILVQTIALGGFKQPQQLMALNWFLSLGAEFDLVINLDGFNEVALPPTENVPTGTNPFFPRIWHNRVRVPRDLSLLAVYGEIEYQKSLRARRAERLNESPWRFSVLRNLVWKSRDKRILSRISERELFAQSYLARNTHLRPLVVTGPRYDWESTASFYGDLAASWARASRQMHDVATGQGILYFHFLQPNQYLAGSKPFSETERREHILEAQPYRLGVENGYPLLIEKGRELKRDGVSFVDLTGMFSENTETLYSDACCHLSREGYDLVVREIVESMRPSFQSPL